MSRYIRKGIRILFPSGKAYSREWLDDHPDVKERLLRTHAHERVSCCCKKSGVEMTIRHRKGVHHLANLPHKSHYHSVSCPSYAPDEITSGLRHYAAGAIAQSADVKHCTIRAEAPHESPFTHFSYDAFLQLMWEEAGLTLWSPRMLGKRNYFTARSALLSASNSLWLTGNTASRPLADILFIPSRSSTTDAAPSSTTPSNFLVTGQLLRIVRGPHSLGLVLKYDRRVFWVSENRWTLSLVSLLGSYDSPSLLDDGRYVFVLLDISMTAAGNFSVNAIGSLPLTRHWIPAFSTEEASLISRLIDEDRRFFRCLSYDARTDTSIPLVSLVDTDEPACIYNPLTPSFPAVEQVPSNASGVAV